MVDKVLTCDWKQTNIKLPCRNTLQQNWRNYTYRGPRTKVIILGTEPEHITPEQLSEVVENCNKGFLAERGYLALKKKRPSN